MDTLITTVVTDAKGNYNFSNATGTNTGSSKFGLTMLTPNTGYKVVIPNVTGASKQAALGTNELTLANANGGTPGTQPDLRDSDGLSVGNNAEAIVLTSDIPRSGANNHTFDFGFMPATLSCSVLSITANPGACQPATNDYTLTGTVNFINPPTTGSMIIQVVGQNSDIYTAPFTSPQNYSITNLPADGILHTVNMYFSEDENCLSTINYMAPADCMPMCNVSLTANPGFCDPVTNSYTLTGVATLSNPPLTGTLTISVNGGMSQVFTAPFASSINYSISNLTSDGSTQMVMADFSADPSCQAMATYMAPRDCSCGITLYQICPGESFTLTAESGYQNYKWYKNNVLIAGATSISYTVTEIGLYKWSALDGTGCPISPCCEYTFEEGACCTLSATVTQPPNCYDNTTPVSAGDDQIKFALKITSTGSNTKYSITSNAGPVNPTMGTYGVSTEFGLSSGTAGGGAVTLTITDTEKPGCNTTVVIEDPGTCSEGSVCVIDAEVLTTLVCSANNTEGTAVDDYISFYLNPVGLGLSNSYVVSVIQGGGTITPSSAIYGTPTLFRFNDGSASQQYKIIRITDSSTSGCYIDVEYSLLVHVQIAQIRHAHQLM